MLHHCMTCNVSQYLQKNAAYIKPLKKKKSSNNLKIMDSDTLFLTHINAERKEINKSNQVHMVLHAGLFFL